MLEVGLCASVVAPNLSYGACWGICKDACLDTIEATGSERMSCARHVQLTTESSGWYASVLAGWGILKSSLMTQPVLALFFNPWFHDAIWAYLCTQCVWGQSDDGLDQFGRGTRHDQAFTSRIVDHFQHGIDRANSFFRRPASWSAFLFYCKAAHGIPHSTSGGRLPRKPRRPDRKGWHYYTLIILCIYRYCTNDTSIFAIFRSPKCPNEMMPANVVNLLPLACETSSQPLGTELLYQLD